jgi:integrase
VAKQGRIGIRDVEALEPGQTIWDSVVKGFGARRQIGETRSYFLKYRTAEGRQRWFTIGTHDAPWKPETARTEAQKLLGAVAKEQDPAADKKRKRNATTVAELCDLYMTDAEAGLVTKRNGRPKKASTLAIDKGRIAHHIKPLLGSTSVAALTLQDVERMRKAIASGKVRKNVKTKPRGVARVAGGKGAANRSVGLLGGIMSYAVREGMRTDNPVKGVGKFADGQKDRRLSADEYLALDAALAKATEAKIWPPAIAVARFLAVSGWRVSEALNLRWSEVDLLRRTVYLSDSKTDGSTRPLSHAAADVVREMVNFRVSDTGPVFPATRGDQGLDKGFWRKIAKLGQLSPDVTPNVLRHSVSSEANDLGYTEATIALIVGHKRGRSMTSHYIHRPADAVLLAAADAVADHISALMGHPRGDARVVELRAAAQ